MKRTAEKILQKKKRTKHKGTKNYRNTQFPSYPNVLSYNNLNRFHPYLKQKSRESERQKFPEHTTHKKCKVRKIMLNNNMKTI